MRKLRTQKNNKTQAAKKSSELPKLSQIGVPGGGQIAAKVEFFWAFFHPGPKMGRGVVVGSKKAPQRRPKGAKGLPKGTKKTRKKHLKGFHEAFQFNKQVHWKFYRQFKKQCYCQCNRQCNRQPQAPTRVDVNKIQLDVAMIVCWFLLPYKSVQSRLQVIGANQLLNNQLCLGTMDHSRWTQKWHGGGEAVGNWIE